MAKRRVYVSGFSLNTHNGASEGTNVYGETVSRARARGTLAACRSRMNELRLNKHYFGGFQETHDRRFLKNLLARQSVGTAYKGQIVRPPFDGAGPQNALITSLPILDSGYEEFVPAEPISLVCDWLGDFLQCSDSSDLSENVCGPEDAQRLRFSRPVVWADLEFPGGVTVRVYVVHTKSKRRTNLDSEDELQQRFRSLGMMRSLLRRSSDAIGLRWLLDEYFAATGNPAIVLGDVNDDPQAITTQMMMGEEPFRFAPAAEKSALWATQLFDVVDVQARRGDLDVRANYSYVYLGHHSRLDQILVSNHFNIKNPKHVGFVRHTKVFHDNVYDRTLEGNPPTHSLDHGTPLVTLGMGSY